MCVHLCMQCVCVCLRRCADNVLAAWAVFLVLTYVHVWANIRALRCLVLSSLNQPRLNLLLQHYMDEVGGMCLGVCEVERWGG